jgi:hypothetical protein
MALTRFWKQSATEKLLITHLLTHHIRPGYGVKMANNIGKPQPHGDAEMTVEEIGRELLSTASFRADAGLGIVGSPSPDSDYWYQGVGHRSSAGPTISAGSATRLAAVFASTRVCAETLSSLPVGIYRERKSGGRDAATDHPAQELFLTPNPWQTGMEFFEMMQAHLELRGNAYALKVTGNGRAIDQLSRA